VTEGAIDFEGKGRTLHMAPIRDVFVEGGAVVVAYGDDAETRATFYDMRAGWGAAVDMSEPLADELREFVGFTAEHETRLAEDRTASRRLRGVEVTERGKRYSIWGLLSVGAAVIIGFLAPRSDVALPFIAFGWIAGWYLLGFGLVNRRRGGRIASGEETVPRLSVWEVLLAGFAPWIALLLAVGVYTLIAD
jgi:hypothetical protein